MMAAMIRLQRGKVLRVPQAAGKTVVVHDGTLSIAEARTSLSLES
jgi:hypothetical protein